MSQFVRNLLEATMASGVPPVTIQSIGRAGGNSSQPCVHCGRRQGEHQANTQACPVGNKTRAGFIHYSKSKTFTPRNNLTEELVPVMVPGRKVMDRKRHIQQLPPGEDDDEPEAQSESLASILTEDDENGGSIIPRDAIVIDMVASIKGGEGAKEPEGKGPEEPVFAGDDLMSPVI